jgi:outer membrane protein assembly factor BamB
MKSVLKKIAATAMAFTLLGTGTAITQTVSPKSDNTLVASAACNHKREYESTEFYGYAIVDGDPIFDSKVEKKNGRTVITPVIKGYKKVKVAVYRRCRKCYFCNKFLYWC